MALQAAALATDPLGDYAKNETSWSDTIAQIRKRLRSQFQRRLLVARMLHPFLLSTTGQQLLSFAGSHNLLPFHPLYRSLR